MARPAPLHVLLGILAASALLAIAVIKGQSDDTLLSKVGSSKQRLEQLYDIPNFVYQRTQMHFPQAEENWLNQAAEGKIGDDVKPEPILNKLNDIIADARTHALTENYEARVKAKKVAIEDNYSTYDVQKGKVVHKIYGKQVGGSMTLKQTASNTPATLKATNSDSSLESNIVQQLSQLPSDHVAPSKTETKPYAVQVPAGLHSGQQFIAKVPGFGRMLVTVPPTVQAGQLVSIQVPVPATATAKPSLRRVSKAAAVSAPRAVSEHPIAAKMLDSALASHDREVVQTSASYAAGDSEDEGSEDAKSYAGSEHPNAASMLDKALKAHYSSSRRARRAPAPAAAVDSRFTYSGSEHPVAAGMLSEALDNHYHSTPHNVFGLEH